MYRSQEVQPAHTARFGAFPLARIDDSLDMLGKAKHMSTLDNSSAFWSILLHPDSRLKAVHSVWDKGTGPVPIQEDVLRAEECHCHICKGPYACATWAHMEEVRAIL